MTPRTSLVATDPSPEPDCFDPSLLLDYLPAYHCEVAPVIVTVTGHEVAVIGYLNSELLR
jgi:hypothetical protein